MKSLDIFEQIGVVLIGFSIYEAIYGTWSPLIPVSVQSDEFGILRAVVVLLFTVSVALSLLISHRSNALLFTDDFRDIEFSERVSKIRRRHPLVSLGETSLALIALIIALLLFGGKAAFLLWLGFSFVNGGPWAAAWIEKK